MYDRVKVFILYRDTNAIEYCGHCISLSRYLSLLGYIYITAKAKATSLPICCIVSYLCVYTTAISERQKIKENYRFCFHFNENALRAKVKAKETLLPTCCIVSTLCVYTTVMSERQKIKEKYRFRSNIKEPLV